VNRRRRRRARDLDVHRGETGDIRKAGVRAVNHRGVIDEEPSCSAAYQGVEEVLTSI